MSSFIVVILLSPLLSKAALKLGVVVPKKNWVFFTLPLAFLTHLAFGVKTPMTEQLLSSTNHTLLKLGMLVLLGLSLKGIKKAS